MADLDSDLQQLEAQWDTSIEDPTILQHACVAATEKWKSKRVEGLNRHLEEELTKQQFAFAALETAILRAPLHSSSREMFKAITLHTQLPRDPIERRQRLQGHWNQAMDRVARIVDTFAGSIASSPSPYSETSIAGGKRHTYLGNVLVLELPCTSLKRLFSIVSRSYMSIINEIPRIYGVHTDITVSGVRDDVIAASDAVSCCSVATGVDRGLSPVHSHQDRH